MKINPTATALTVVLLLMVSAGCQDSRTTDAGAPQAIARGNEITISAHCLVTYYHGENAGYFSEQKHTITLGSNAIDMTADEPGGTFRWQLAGGAYESSGPTATVEAGPVGVIDRDIVVAILTAFNASAGYYGSESVTKPDKTRIDGKWYQPVQLGNIAIPSTTITLLQSLQDGAIDLVWVHNTQTNAVTTGRAYNMAWLKAAGTFVPTKIDIFRREAGAAADKKILQVNYRSFSAPLRKKLPPISG